MAARLRKHALALIAVAVYNLVVFFPTAFLGRVLSPNDVFFNTEPWKLYRGAEGVQNSLLSDPPTSYFTLITLLKTHWGSFHWNPYVGSGIPGFGSSAAAVLSPFILIPALLLPLVWVYGGIVFLKLNLAFWFAYRWLREERLGKRGAAIGAILVAGAGVYSVRWLWQITNATALYPALLWLVARAFHGKRNSVALMTLVALAYALAGFPAAMAYGAYVAVAYAIFLMIRERRMPALRIGEGIAAALIALLLAAPSLVSFAQLVQRSGYLEIRARTATATFPAPHWRSFLQPERLGNPALKSWLGDRALGSMNNYVESTVYVGVIGLPLMVIGLARRRARTRWFWLALLLFVLACIFGYARFAGSLPGFKYSPLTRLVLLLPLPAGYLAAAGASWLNRGRMRAVLAIAIAAAASYDLALFAGRFYPYLEPAKATVPVTPTIAYLQAQRGPFRIAPMFDYLLPNSAELFRLEDVRSHFSSEAKYRRLLQQIDPRSWSGQSTIILFNATTFRFGDPLVSVLGIRYLIEQPSIDIVKWHIFAATKPGVKEKSIFILEPGQTAERTIAIGNEPFEAIELPAGMEESFTRAPRLHVELRKLGLIAWERDFTPDDLAVMEKAYIPLRPFARAGESVVLRIRADGIRARLLGSEDGGIYYGRVTTPIIFDRQFPDGRLFLNVAELPRFRAEPPGNASVELVRYADARQVLRTNSSAPFFLASSEKLTPELAITIDGKPARPVETHAVFAGVNVPAGRHHVVFERVVGRGWWWATILGALLWVGVAGWEVIAARRRG
ncbi:MAG TPA: hypothetical protein VGR02_11860 [Thermoanaerobaculia bacterium]|nr:hypothetical protein [Thermoanaerobaculia bacterium]